MSHIKQVPLQSVCFVFLQKIVMWKGKVAKLGDFDTAKTLTEEMT